MNKTVEIRYDRGRDELEVSMLISKAQSVIVFRMTPPEAISFIRELHRELHEVRKAQPKRLRLIPKEPD